MRHPDTYPDTSVAAGVTRCRRTRSLAAALLLLAGVLAGCLAGRGSPASAVRVARADVPGRGAPVLPDTLYPYAAAAQAAVARLVGVGGGGPGFRGGRGGPRASGRGGRGGGGRALDNTPAANPVTDAGATLGRVLFYDPRLSANDQVACASCHVQAFGFSDTARFSRGFAGGRTRRHSMGLANAALYRSGRFFWDERAATLEAQVLAPIQDPVEMGMPLDRLERKLRATPYYAPLFAAAFGTPEVTSERVSRALAQFVRALVSADSRFDRGALTPEEREGLRLFTGAARCAQCHLPNALSADAARNTGLDAAVADSGAGRGRFKAPSLRNVAARAPYMHDGRFATLEQVVKHYDDGVQPNPDLDPRLRGRGGAPRSLGLTGEQKAALVAYLHALTDSSFLRAPQLADPFPPARRP
jgi:cytochrome c peroxidase